MTRLYLSIAACSATCLAPLAAQDTQLRTAKLRALCFQHVADVRKLHAVVPGDNPRAVEIDLYTSTFSDDVEIPIAGNRLHFAVKDPDANATEGFRVITSAAAVAGPRQLALFVPGESPDEPYRCVILDDSLENFPMGSTMAVNLAPTPFRFTIGEHDVTVAPGGIGRIPMARKANDRGQVSVIISIADPQQPDQWLAVSQTRWFSGTDKRDLIISFLHPQSGKPTVRSYADSPGTDGQ